MCRVIVERIFRVIVDAVVVVVHATLAVVFVVGYVIGVDVVFIVEEVVEESHGVFEVLGAVPKSVVEGGGQQTVVVGSCR